MFWGVRAWNQGTESKGVVPAQIRLAAVWGGLLAAVAASGPHVSAAAPRTGWTNPGAGDWFDPANWSDGVPTTSHEAYVNQGTAQLRGSSSQPAKLTLGGTVNAPPSFVEVLDGGRLMPQGKAYVGYAPGSVGTLIVRGADAQFAPSDKLYVGQAGTGFLHVEEGGIVNTTEARIGDFSISQGTVTVSGAGSVWNSSSFVYVGYRGQGTLNIEQGGQFHSNALTMAGRWSSASGIINITGNGSLLDTQGMAVGLLGGTGTLNVKDGGALTSAGFVDVCNSAGAEAAATVSGAGSRVETCTFAVGRHGRGILNIEAGGTVVDTWGHLGKEPDSIGIATVSGPGSLWSNSRSLRVGNAGPGALQVEAGGRVTANQVYLGYNPGVQGTLTLTGADSRLQTLELYLGHKGAGTLSIEAGASVLSTSAYLGYDPGAQGTATVIGAGSTWDIESLSLWRGSLTARDQAVVTVGGTLAIGADGKLALEGATLQAATIQDIAGGSALFQHGTLRIGAYQGDLVNTGCHLRRGEAKYGMEVTGNYTQGPDAALLIEVAGLPASGLFDTLSVSGTAELHGTLRLDFSRFAPPPGTSYQFLDADRIAGTFDQYEVLGLDPTMVSYDIPAGMFTIVPEPAGLWLLVVFVGTGGLLLLCSRGGCHWAETIVRTRNTAQG